MRVIPIKLAGSGGAALADEARMRLERAGYLRMMALAEPRLSEFVARYEALGYEIELVPYTDDDVPGKTDSEVGSRPATIYVRKRKPPTGAN